MNVEFALDFIPRRMKELGYGNDYITRWRYIQLDRISNTVIQANNEYFILITPPPTLIVKSKNGIFDLYDTALNELQYEHKGKIEIRNRGNVNLFVLFIQVIPNHLKK